MSVPPFLLLRHIGGVPANQIVTIYIAMTHAWAYPFPPLLRHMGGYLPIIMLLYIAMTHTGCGLKLCSVTKNSDDIYPRACLGITFLKICIKAR